MSDFTAIGQLVNEARNLLDSIKGGAIRKMETTFGALMSKFQGDVNTFIGSSQSRLTAMESSLTTAVKNQMTMTVHVDCVSGSDTNAGTSSAPIKTIGKAVGLIPNGGSLEIIMHSDITALFGAAIGSSGRHALSVDGGKRVTINLSGHALVVRSSHYNSWVEGRENSVNPSLNIGFSCSSFSSLSFSDGRIDIQYQAGDQGKDLYSHVALSALFNGALSKFNLSNVEVYSNIPSVGLFGADGWYTSMLFAHLRSVTFTGSGLLKRAYNGGKVDDIKLNKLDTSYGSWT